MRQLETMMVEHNDWIASEIEAIIKNSRSTIIDDKTQYEIQWPILEQLIDPRDIFNTANFVSKKYASFDIFCTLSGIDAALSGKIDIDYFFYRMHVLGHAVINNIRPELDLDNISDVALIEVSSTLFAAVACRHFYGIEHLSVQMAQELFSVMSDQVEVDYEDGQVYTSTDRKELCNQMLEVIISETSFASN